jgi:hypothetical protein
MMNCFQVKLSISTCRYMMAMMTTNRNAATSFVDYSLMGWLRQGLTLVPISAQLELTFPSAQLELTLSPI